MLTLEEARRTIADGVGATLRTLRTLDEHHWDAPTPCAGWTVRDLVAHLAWGQRLEGTGLAAMHAGSTTTIAVPPVTERDPAELVAALQAEHAFLLAGIDAATEADLHRIAPMPFGPAPLALLLQVITNEVAIHGHDLLSALGTPRPVTSDAMRGVTATLTAFLPVLAAGGTPPPDPVAFRLVGHEHFDVTLEWTGSAWQLGPADMATVTISGDDTAVALFALGRLDAAHPTLRIQGDRTAAERFKQHVPGPY